MNFVTAIHCKSFFEAAQQTLIFAYFETDKNPEEIRRATDQALVCEMN